MLMIKEGNREARTYKIPTIEIYEVTEDQLDLIDESCRSLSQDLSFSIASLSICASFVIALLSASPSATVQSVYVIVVVVTLLWSLYTGWRWLRLRRTSRSIIQKIRSRKMDPESYQVDTTP